MIQIINFIECTLICVYSLLSLQVIFKIEKKRNYQLPNRCLILSAIITAFISSLLEIGVAKGTITLGTIGMRYFASIILVWFYYFHKNRFLK